MEQSFGTLVITVKKASLIHDTELMGKMDPFARIIIGKVEQKTTVKSKAGKVPEWNETFEFSAKNGDLIDFTIWDKEELMADDFVGGTKIVVNTDTMISKQETWSPIFYGTNNKDKGGEVLLELQYHPRDEKNILVSMLEGRKIELLHLQNNEKVLREEVTLLKDTVNQLKNENEELKAQFEQEKDMLIKSYEGQKQGLDQEKNNQLVLITEISALKESVRAEKATILQNEEKNQNIIKQLSSENEALKDLLKSQQNNENILREEVAQLKDTVNQLSKEKEDLKIQFKQEKDMLIKSYERQNEGSNQEKNNDLVFITEISVLKESVRALQAEKATILKNEEKSQINIKQLNAENEALKQLLKPKPITITPISPTHPKKREVEIWSFIIFAIYFVGSKIIK